MLPGSTQAIRKIGYNNTLVLRISAITGIGEAVEEKEVIENIVPSSTLGEDTTLSRWKTGFDSRWDDQIVYLSRLG